MLLLRVYFLMLRGMVCVWEFARASAATSTSHILSSLIFGDHTFWEQEHVPPFECPVGAVWDTHLRSPRMPSTSIAIGGAILRAVGQAVVGGWEGGVCGERGARVCGFSRTTFFSGLSLGSHTPRRTEKVTRGARAPNQPSQPVQGEHTCQTNVVCGYIAWPCCVGLTALPCERQKCL
jgi:hypothetical protein